MIDTVDGLKDVVSHLVGALDELVDDRLHCLGNLWTRVEQSRIYQYEICAKKIICRLVQVSGNCTCGWKSVILSFIFSIMAASSLPCESHDFDKVNKNLFANVPWKIIVHLWNRTWYARLLRAQHPRREGGERTETHVFDILIKNVPPSSRQTSFLRPWTALREVACDFCTLSRIPAENRCQRFNLTRCANPSVKAC